MTTMVDGWTIPLEDAGLWLRLTFDIDLRDTPCSAFGINIGVSITIDSFVKLVSKNLIVGHSIASWNVDDWDVIGCSFLVPGAGAIATNVTAAIIASVISSSFSECWSQRRASRHPPQQRQSPPSEHTQSGPDRAYRSKFEASIRLARCVSFGTSWPIVLPPGGPSDRGFPLVAVAISTSGERNCD